MSGLTMSDIVRRGVKDYFDSGKPMPEFKAGIGVDPDYINDIHRNVEAKLVFEGMIPPPDKRSPGEGDRLFKVIREAVKDDVEFFKEVIKKAEAVKDSVEGRAKHPEYYDAHESLIIPPLQKMFVEAMSVENEKTGEKPVSEAMAKSEADEAFKSARALINRMVDEQLVPVLKHGPEKAVTVEEVAQGVRKDPVLEKIFDNVYAGLSKSQQTGQLLTGNPENAVGMQPFDPDMIVAVEETVVDMNKNKELGKDFEFCLVEDADKKNPCIAKNMDLRLGDCYDLIKQPKAQDLINDMVTELVTSVTMSYNDCVNKITEELSKLPEVDESFTKGPNSRLLIDGAILAAASENMSGSNIRYQNLVAVIDQNALPEGFSGEAAKGKSYSEIAKSVYDSSAKNLLSNENVRSVLDREDVRSVLDREIKNMVNNFEKTGSLDDIYKKISDSLVENGVVGRTLVAGRGFTDVLLQDVRNKFIEHGIDVEFTYNRDWEPEVSKISRVDPKEHHQKIENYAEILKSGEVQVAIANEANKIFVGYAEGYQPSFNYALKSCQQFLEKQAGFGEEAYSKEIESVVRGMMIDKLSSQLPVFGKEDIIDFSDGKFLADLVGQDKFDDYNKNYLNSGYKSNESKYDMRENFYAEAKKIVNQKEFQDVVGKSVDGLLYAIEVTGRSKLSIMDGMYTRLADDLVKAGVVDRGTFVDRDFNRLAMNEVVKHLSERGFKVDGEFQTLKDQSYEERQTEKRLDHAIEKALDSRIDFMKTTYPNSFGAARSNGDVGSGYSWEAKLKDAVKEFKNGASFEAFDLAVNDLAQKGYEMGYSGERVLDIVKGLDRNLVSEFREGMGKGFEIAQDRELNLGIIGVENDRLYASLNRDINKSSYEFNPFDDEIPTFSVSLEKDEDKPKEYAPESPFDPFDFGTSTSGSEIFYNISSSMKNTEAERWIGEAVDWKIGELTNSRNQEAFFGVEESPSLRYTVLPQGVPSAVGCMAVEGVMLGKNGPDVVTEWKDSRVELLQEMCGKVIQAGIAVGDKFSQFLSESNLTVKFSAALENAVDYAKGSLSEEWAGITESARMMGWMGEKISQGVSRGLEAVGEKLHGLTNNFEQARLDKMDAKHGFDSLPKPGDPKFNLEGIRALNLNPKRFDTPRKLIKLAEDCGIAVDRRLREDIVSRSQTPHLMTELGRDIIATACLRHEMGDQIKPVNAPEGRNPAPLMKMVDNDGIKFAVIRNVDNDGKATFSVSVANYNDGQGGRLEQPKFEEIKAEKMDSSVVTLPAMQSKRDGEGKVLMETFAGQNGRTFEGESKEPIRNPNTRDAVMEAKMDKGEVVRTKDVPVPLNDVAKFDTLEAALKAGNEVVCRERMNQLNNIPAYMLKPEEKREEIKRDADKAKAGKDDDPYGIA